MTAKAPVRKDSKVSGRFYAIGDQMLPSVTHILSAISKPALVAWAANTERAACTEAAADLYEEMAAQPDLPQMPRSWYVSTLTDRLGTVKANQRELAKAGEIGTQIHSMIEWLMRTALNRQVGPKPVISEPAQHAVRAFEEWAASVSLEPLMVEHTVYSMVHGFAGTMDLLARVNGVPTLVDIKSGKSVYSEAHLQVAAYMIALEEMGHERPTQALIIRVPKVVSDPEVEVVPVPPVADLFPVFLATKVLWAFQFAQDAAYRARRGAE